MIIWNGAFCELKLILIWGLFICKMLSLRLNHINFDISEFVCVNEILIFHLKLRNERPWCCTEVDFWLYNCRWIPFKHVKLVINPFKRLIMGNIDRSLICLFHHIFGREKRIISYLIDASLSHFHMFTHQRVSYNINLFFSVRKNTLLGTELFNMISQCSKSKVTFTIKLWLRLLFNIN
jgi:hypothetical protein